MIFESVLAILTSIFSGLSISKYFNISGKVKSNWSSLQCTTVGSWIYPFFGPKSVSITDNQANCESGKFNSMFNVNFAGHLSNITDISKVTSGLTDTVNNVRNKISSIERSVFNDLNAVWSRLWSVYVRITQVFIVLFQIVEKLLKLFMSILQILADAYCTLGSTWNGPMGDAARYFCFSKNTLVKVSDNRYIPINKVKLNTSLANNRKVLSIFKFSSNNVDMYNYKDVIVSGSHLVFENNKWIRVKSSEKSKKIQNKYKPKYIYCLQTSDNKIEVDKNILFADYEETLNNNINNQMMKEVFKVLNKDFEYDLNKFYLNGFEENSKLLLDNLVYKPIKDIKVGDILANNSKVVGKVKRKVNNIELFMYKDYILSGLDIVLENNKWIPVCKSKHAVRYNKKLKYLYHIQTNTDKIITKNFEIRSFMPVSDNTNDIIDEIIEDYLNRNIKKHDIKKNNYRPIKKFRRA